MTEGKVLYSADFTPVGSPCPECEGQGFKEYQAGLIQIGCETCNGTGKTGPREALNDSDGRARPTDTDTGGSDTSKPKRTSKPKKKKKLGKRAK